MIVRSGITKKHPNTQSLTQEEITTLKMKVLSSESVAKPIGTKIGDIIQNVLHYCTVTSSGSMKSQCEMYGHRLGPRGKDDNYQCADCKAVINGPQDLRKASPTKKAEACDGSWRSNSRTRR